MMYLDRLARVCPPRAGATYGSGAVRVLAVNSSTTAKEVDNDIFQFPTAANATAVPGSFGRALVRFQGDLVNPVYINFGATSNVTANSAATSGNTCAGCIPAGQDRDFELDPQIDKYFQCTTANGAGLTGTIRYWIVSMPSQSNNADG